MTNTDKNNIDKKLISGGATSSYNLKKAQEKKDDEFYTYYKTIDDELQHYQDKLKGKVVLCNCDESWSNFPRYFLANFQQLRINALMWVGLHNPTTTLHIYNGKKEYQIPLSYNGDFRHPQSKEIIQLADIVVTNPPFSLIRQFYDTLMDLGKDFLFIAPVSFSTYRPFVHDLRDKKVYSGYTDKQSFFKVGDKSSYVGSYWVTTLDTTDKPITIFQNNQPLPQYIPLDPPYNHALNVPALKNIPLKYKGYLALPVTILLYFPYDKYKVIDLVKPKIMGKVIFNRIIVRTIDNKETI